MDPHDDHAGVRAELEQGQATLLAERRLQKQLATLASQRPALAGAHPRPGRVPRRPGRAAREPFVIMTGARAGPGASPWTVSSGTTVGAS